MQHMSWYKPYIIMREEGQIGAWFGMSFKEKEERGLVEIEKRHSRDFFFLSVVDLQRGLFCFLSLSQ